MAEESYNVGIVGATGAVGKELVRLLRKREFPIKGLKLLASKRSAGKTLDIDGMTYGIDEATPEAFAGLDVALFSAGASISKDLAPAAVERGCTVVDNSSAFRMEEGVPLVIAEVNPQHLDQHRGIIANPNCSTMIAVMALAPLHQEFGLRRVIASTYQAVSGSGAEGITELENQTRAWAAGQPEPAPEVYPHPIAFNLLPHVDVFQDNGYTKEELKMRNETRKIMDLPDLRVSCTCVRVPVFRAHSISVHAEFEKPVDVARAREVIAAFDGVQVQDDPAANGYPLPRECSGKEDCAVGRLRVDDALDNGLAFWVVGDQLWKGAALNTIQIAEAMIGRGCLKAVGV